MFLQGKPEKGVCFPTRQRKPLPLLARCSRSFPRTAEPALTLLGRLRARPADSLTPPPEGKLIILLIPVSFIQNLAFLLEVSIKKKKKQQNTADQSAPKHLILDGASSSPGFCSHPFEVISVVIAPAPSRGKTGTRTVSLQPKEPNTRA